MERKEAAPDPSGAKFSFHALCWGQVSIMRGSPSTDPRWHAPCDERIVHRDDVNLVDAFLLEVIVVLDEVGDLGVASAREGCGDADLVMEWVNIEKEKKGSDYAQ